MSMDEAMFEKYAQHLEWEDFEEEVLGLTGSLKQLVEARRDTIEKLRSSADYLDSIWLRCRVSKTMGTSASMAGGILTISGGILTALTAGAATPVLIAGIATSSVGAATNIGTSLAEKIINSRQVKSLNQALERDKEITLKLESQIDDIRRYKDSAHLHTLLLSIETLLGSNHLIITILKGLLLMDMSNTAANLAAGFAASSIGATAAAITGKSVTDLAATTVVLAQAAAENAGSVAVSAAAAVNGAAIQTAVTGAAGTAAALNAAGSSASSGAAAAAAGSSLAAEGAALAASGAAAVAAGSSLAAAGAAVAAGSSSVAVVETGKQSAVAVLKQTARDGVKYNPIDAGVFVEGGKVIGQNSIRVAGQIIIGISAAFLVWDAIDLGFTISDLVRRQGSKAGKILREKADTLEAALEDTVGKYSLKMPD